MIVSPVLLGHHGDGVSQDGVIWTMHALEIRTVRALRGKIFANLATMESFCSHLRKAMAETGAVELEDYTDRELAQMVQQWLSVGDTAVEVASGQVSASDITDSFAVLERACQRFLGPDFTLEEQQALGSLATYLQRRLPGDGPGQGFSTGAAPVPTGRQVVGKGFFTRFWDAFTSA